MTSLRAAIFWLFWFLVLAVGMRLQGQTIVWSPDTHNVANGTVSGFVAGASLPQVFGSCLGVPVTSYKVNVVWLSVTSGYTGQPVSNGSVWRSTGTFTTGTTGSGTIPGLSAGGISLSFSATAPTTVLAPTISLRYDLVRTSDSVIAASQGVTWAGSNSLADGPAGVSGSPIVVLSGTPTVSFSVAGSPTPHMVTGTTAFTGVKASTFDIYEDGTTFVGTGTVGSDGSISFSGTSAWNGHVISGTGITFQSIDGKVIPFSYPLFSGTYDDGTGMVGDFVASGSLARGNDMGVVSVSSDGIVSSNPVNQSSLVTPSGTSTVYSYGNADGSQTSLIYSGNGSGAATAADVRQLSAQNDAGQQQEIAQLQATGSMLGSKLDEINTTLGGTGTGSGTGGGGGGGASPTPLPSVPSAESIASAIAGPSPSPADDDGVVGSDPGSEIDAYDSSFWKISLGSFGTLDLDVNDYPDLLLMASWLRNLIVVMATTYVLFWVYRLMMESSVAWAAADPGVTFGIKTSITEVIAAFVTTVAAAAETIATGGLGAGVGAVLSGLGSLTFGVLKFLGPYMVTLALGLLPALPTLISGVLSVDFFGSGFGSAGARYVFGGNNLSTALYTAVFNTSGPVFEGIGMANKFIPILHLCVCIGNCLSVRVLVWFWLKTVTVYWKGIPR